LKDLMRDRVAAPTYADVSRDGVGSVHFDRAEDVRRAIKELDDTKFQGARITVKEDTSSGNSSRGDRYHPYSRDSGKGSPSRRSPSPRGRSPSPKRSPDRGHRSPSPSPKRSPSPRKSTP
jgi:RNA recognition motif-containing protein